MKRMPRLIGSAIMLAVCTQMHAASFTVDRIDPPHWWAGMKETSLQLQVHGKDIRPAEVTADYPGVRIDSVARLDGSPDWQFVYLTVSPDAKPGKIPLKWKEGKKTVTRDYELRKRTRRSGAAGFDASDVLYMIMPDRFADGDQRNNNPSGLNNPSPVDRSKQGARHGGDLKGIADHISYIDSLGVTAVWLNPVLENDMKGGSYHGYATTDYYRVDPRLGTNEEYAQLIDSLHSRGIKTVMDMIFNHCGLYHPWMAASPASDWVNHPEEYVETNHKLSTVSDRYASDYDRDKAVNGWFVRDMPDLNQKNPHLMKYLIQNSIWWIEEAGIDGIRMDTYPYADKKEMAKWVDAVMKEYPQFNIVGECWFADPALEQYWQKGSPVSADDSRLPTVMDFALMLKSQKLNPFKDQTIGRQGLNDIYSHLAMDYIYADPMKVLRFLDNHDTDRLLDSVPSDLGPWKQAMTLLLTAPGIPQIYYGTELLMSGTREGGDGNVRKDMPGGFPGDTGNVFTAEGRSQLQNEAYDFLSKILKWRKGSEAIAKGDMKHFATDNGIYLFRRKYGDKEAIVVLNGRDEANSADMSRYAEITDPGRRYRDVISGETVTLLNPENPAIEFSPRQIMILEPEK